MSELPTITNVGYTMSNLDTGTWGGTITANNRIGANWATLSAGNITTEMEVTEMSDVKRRIVQVFIVDPDERVSLESAVLYQGEQKLTDATDEELFFEIGMKDCLEKHNAIRETTVDEEATITASKEIYLKPARIRDLKMVVINVATF